MRVHERLVGQQRFMRPASQVDDAFLLPFPHDFDVTAAPFRMHILECETAQLAAAQPRVRERHNDGIVPRVIGCSGLDGGHHFLDLVLGQRLDRERGLLGALQLLQHFGAGGAFLVQPGGEAFDRAYMLIDGERADGLVAPSAPSPPESAAFAEGLTYPES